MEARLLAHPEWDGLVQGILVNSGGASSGLANCAAATGMPILQDAVNGLFWTALGAGGYQALIFDQDGVLVHKINPAYFSTNPAALDEMETVVLGLLGQ